MNYTTIILVLILLFCIYHMNSKKEGFLVQDNSKEPICPNGYSDLINVCMGKNWNDLGKTTDKKCPDDYPKKVANNTRCCPADKPYYEDNTKGPESDKGKTCRANALVPTNILK